MKFAHTVDSLSMIRNGDASATYEGCVNLSFHCVEGESLLMALKVPSVTAGIYIMQNTIVEGEWPLGKKNWVKSLKLLL